MATYTHDDHPLDMDLAKVQEIARLQSEFSLTRYHYLRAAVTGVYEIKLLPPTSPTALPNLREGFDFSAYTDYKLEPLVGMKLHLKADGSFSIHSEDLDYYKGLLFHGWKTREGGILYAVGEERPFWNMVLSYNSPKKTMGIKAWDKLLEEWKAADFAKDVIPCMFFATQFGCMDPSCSFKHDAEAAKKDKDLVYAFRRAQVGKLTEEDIKSFPLDANAAECSPADDGWTFEHIQGYIEDPEPPVCWNFSCVVLEENPDAARHLQACSRCKFTT